MIVSTHIDLMLLAKELWRIHIRVTDRAAQRKQEANKYENMHDARAHNPSLIVYLIDRTPCRKAENENRNGREDAEDEQEGN